jgi:extracellular elastinolytic metalloproteinase
MFRRNHTSLLLVVLMAGCALDSSVPDDHPTGVHAPPPGESLTPPAPDTPREISDEFLRDLRPDRVVDSAVVVGESRLTRAGRIHVRMEQRVDGLRVVGAYARAAVDEQGRLLHLIDNLAALPTSKLVSGGNDAAALASALVHVGLLDSDPMVEAPRVERIAFADGGGALRTGYLVETWSRRDNLLHHSVVDEAGQVVSSELRTQSDRYNVFAEDPDKGPQVVTDGPGAGNAESPIGWLGAGEQLSIHIVGNNTKTYLDARQNNQPDRGGVPVESGEFLTAADLTQSPTTASNREAAVQNLFFHNNLVHDVLYRHGFDEAAGNFQEDNFENGGADGDPVLAEAQDGSGTDNANFATPTDGRSGRMQMYLWTGDGPTHQVAINAPTTAIYDAVGGALGRAFTAEGVTGDVVVVNDGVGTGSDGCEPLSGLSGRIALIDRGTCAFTVKILNAQTAGAVSVIMVNNVAGDPIVMGGEERRIRIPSLMISQADGAAIVAMTGVNATSRLHPNPPLQRDASLDSDVVYHEYAHGLSWRMIGGMSGPLSGAIGEGNSDGIAMLMNGDDRIGEYSFSSAGGIRSAPYSGYGRTYADVTGTGVHFDGEVYAAVIWRMMELFGSGGIGNDGMNYTPASPAFEDMRDGILQSAIAAGGAHSCLIWQAFAQYGVGVGAAGVVNADGTVTVTESFELPAECQ